LVIFPDKGGDLAKVGLDVQQGIVLPDIHQDDTAQNAAGRKYLARQAAFSQSGFKKFNNGAEPSAEKYKAPAEQSPGCG